MENVPFISVIIPTYNRKRILNLNLLSLLYQDYPKDKYEIIVVDDGSDDGTSRLVNEFMLKDLRIKYFFQEDNGFRVGQARNLGASKAKGEILIFLNDDIVSLPNLIKNHVAAIKNYDVILGYTSAYCHPKEYNLESVEKVLMSGRGLSTSKLIKDFRHSYFMDLSKNVVGKDNWGFFVATNFSIRKELFDKEHFDESFVGWGVEDEEYGYRLYSKGFKIKLDKSCIGLHMPHEGENNILIFTPEKINERVKNFLKFYEMYPNEEVEGYIWRRYSDFPNEFKTKNLRDYLFGGINNLKLDYLPREVKIELTGRCNLNCSFCFNTNSFESDIGELKTEDIFKIIEKVKDSGVKEIRFTGGEPFLRKDIFEILEYSKSKGLYVRVNTNFTLVKEEHILRLKDCVDQFHIPVNEMEFDLMINDSGADRKKRLIKEFLNLGVRIAFVTVTTKDNIPRLEKISEIIRYFGCDWWLSRQVPTEKDKTPLDNSDVEELVNTLIRINQKYGQNYRIHGLPFCSYDPERVKQVSVGGSICGSFYSLAIDPLGRIKSCYSMDNFLGNVLEDSIVEVWAEGFPVDLRSFKLFPDVCKKCKYVKSCLGGCRFAANFIYGSFDSMDYLAMPDKYRNLLFS